MAKESERQHSSGKTRRRGAALEEALLDAAWAEFQEVGYPSLTMEAVADRAGTSRAVLYRRWRNRAEMVITAMRQHRPMLSGEVPDTGSLRGDVLALLTRVSARLTELGPETLYGILSDLFADTESVAAFQDQVLHIGAGVMATILKHAEERGEVRKGSARGSPRYPPTCSAMSCSSGAPRLPCASSPRSSTTSSSLSCSRR